jgi:lipopolysaccharide transport system permease protein
MTTLPASTTHSARPTPLAALLNPMRLVALWREHRGLIAQFTAREIRATNRDTMLGMVWVVLGPAVMLAVYTLVFGLILGARGGRSATEYALWLYCGLTLFHVFAEPMNRGPSLVAGRPNFVKKIVFPLEILPVSAVGTSLFYAAISTLLLIVGKAIIIRQFTGWEVLFPLALVPAGLLGLAVCAALSAFGVFVRDLRHVISGPVARALFFLTPLVYPLDLVPAPWDKVIMLNPLTSIVQFGRATLIDGQNPDARWWIGLGVVTAVALVAAVVCFAIFTKAKRGFADVL